MRWCAILCKFQLIARHIRTETKPSRQVKCKQHLKLKSMWKGKRRCEKKGKELWSGCLLRFSVPFVAFVISLERPWMQFIYWNTRAREKKAHTRCSPKVKKNSEHNNRCLKCKAFASCISTRNIQSHKFWFFIFEHHRASTIASEMPCSKGSTKTSGKRKQNIERMPKHGFCVLHEIQLILFHLGEKKCNQPTISSVNRFYICQWNWKLNSCYNIALIAFINHMK